MERRDIKLARNKPNTMKLGIFTNIEAPATDFYRTVGTYSYLEHEIKYLDIQNTKWYDIFSCDVIIAKSPNGQLYLDILLSLIHI